jgi:hypothetical protein
MAQTSTPLRLDLALALEVEQFPIAGTLQHHLSQPQRFDGWLELIAAIETLLRAAREQQPPHLRAGAQGARHGAPQHNRTERI